MSAHCSDCCESIETCPAPKETWDPEKDLCSYNETIEYDCDTEISADSTNPEDYAKAIGLCRVTTEDSSLWGLISAKITAPDGSIDVHENSSGLVSKFGNSINPKSGKYMLALTSGKIKGNKFEKFDPANTQGFDPITSGAPSDWVSANGDEFPSAGSCNGTSGTSGDVNDAVMLEMKIKAPKSAKSFSFNIYFFTIEYPGYICSNFNDFFIA